MANPPLNLALVNLDVFPKSDFPAALWSSVQRLYVGGMQHLLSDHGHCVLGNTNMADPEEALHCYLSTHSKSCLFTLRWNASSCNEFPNL